MASEFSFKTKKAEIKEKAENIIDDFIKMRNERKKNDILKIQMQQNSNLLNEEQTEKEIYFDYSPEEIEDWSREISHELITYLSQTYKSVKFITFCSIIEAGEVEMFYESRSVWNPNTDGCIKIIRESTRPRVFASIYVLCP